MARPDLHLFERDLLNKPSNGSNAPPRTIRARDLDTNNKKLTLLQGEGNPPSYTVKYTQDGTIITGLTPIPDPPASGFYVLTASGGALGWTATQDCDA
jgi:hypothetical protein